jgi:hypothetical protein
LNLFAAAGLIGAALVFSSGGGLFSGVPVVAGFVVMTVIALMCTPSYGAEFYSTVWLPFRVFAQLLQSVANVGPTLGTYFVRRLSWPVMLRMALGLEGNARRLPPVQQFPFGVTEGFAKYENMPQDAERRALAQRSCWIVRHLGDVSQTFSKLAVKGADVTSLLREIEADQKLVHAAYYTDDQCVARIADWIADKG